MKRTRQIKLVGLITLISLLMAGCHAPSVSDYNVVWDSPSADFNGSMPIGNGDIGANVWVEDGGDLLFYISKTDAWSENARLLKLGKIRVRLNPSPFVKGCTFKQELYLKNGVIKISSSTKSPETSVDLRFWIDAHNPAIRIIGNMSEDTTVEVMLEHWRTERTKASAGDRSFSGLLDRESKSRGFAYPVFVEPDTVVDGKNNSIVWYHRNKRGEHSVWEDTLKVQGLEDFIQKSIDPLLNLTFGALVQGDGMVSTSPTTLTSTEPMKDINLFVFPLTAQTSTPKEWIQKIQAQAVKYKSKSPESVWTAHKKWWNQFWDRSWIYVDSKATDDAFIVGRGYTLQNWITACGGRGNMPIRFNGSIFAVDGLYRDKNMGPDYRAWGSAFWWQNTRLPYWPMLAAGNYDMIKPLFKMYTDAMPLAQHRIKKYYNFDGAYFPETMYFWGAYRNEDYGWHPKKDKLPDMIRGHHIRYEWQGGIELTAMMLQYYHHTLDPEFLNKTLLPFAKKITMFYDKRYKRNEEGKLVIYPANALEDVWDCTNPTPEVAGLRFILPQLIDLSSDVHEQKSYSRLLKAIPELESDTSKDGKEYLLPAKKGVRRRGNCEKPECYALFPYRLYGVGLPDLEIAKETFRLSPKSMGKQPRSYGWVQDAIFAACIGDVNDASKMLVARSKQIHEESRFPGFWTPTFAWIPNQDHGGVNMTALQHMLIQTEPSSDKIHLCPAWPKEWDCSFKLHAPGKTIVQGKVKNGKVADLIVIPEIRRKDIVNYLNPGSYLTPLICADKKYPSRTIE